MQGYTIRLGHCALVSITLIRGKAQTPTSHASSCNFLGNSSKGRHSANTLWQTETLAWKRTGTLIMAWKTLSLLCN